MKKILLVFGVLIVGLVAVIAIFKPQAVMVALKLQKQKIEQESRLEPRDLNVEFRVNGTARPRNRLSISSQGRVEEILVKEKDNVKKGDIVALVSSTERITLIDSARDLSAQERKKWENVYKPMPVRSPIDGTVICINLEPGQTIPSDKPILVVADELMVFADIDETDLKHVGVGRRIGMSLDAYPDEKFEGIIIYVAYESHVENNVTVYGMQINPLERPKVFRAGMSVIITIPVESKKGVMSLPSAFITDKEQKKTVTVKAGTVKKPIFEVREVTTGITDGKFTEIISGLDASETVVILSQKPKPENKTEQNSF
jgi:macrolide-specific efflux system membrane fusion protein